MKAAGVTIGAPLENAVLQRIVHDMYSIMSRIDRALTAPFPRELARGAAIYGFSVKFGGKP